MGILVLRSIYVGFEARKTRENTALKSLGLSCFLAVCLMVKSCSQASVFLSVKWK